MRKRNALFAAITLWVVGTCAYAAFYVHDVLSNNVLYGYEAEWRSQLFFFSLVRLPWLIALLVLALIVIYKSKRFR